MKRLKILVPTDFSKYARNALDFAVGLSEFYNLEIILFHSLDFEENSKLISNQHEETRIRENLKLAALEKLCEESDFIKSKNHDIYVKIILDKGEVEYNIANIMTKEKVDYIFMGTKGKSGLAPTVFGSYTSNMLIVASCPVFTIPLTSHYRKINKILCLSELDDSELKPIKQSLKLAKIYESEFIIYNAATNASKQERKLSNFKDKINQLSLPYQPIKYVMEKSQDILKSIEDYTCKTQPDLIITLGKERSLWDRLFSKRITKKLCLHSKVPLLSFPETF